MRIWLFILISCGNDKLREMSELDVNEARKRLLNALGESSKSYFDHLKSWFCMKISKEDFDQQARQFLPSHAVHLHNEFLLAVLTKCQSLCQPSAYVYVRRQKPREVLIKKKLEVAAVPAPVIEFKPLVKARPNKTKTKPMRINFENRFQPVDPVSLLPPSFPYPLEKPCVSFCSRDLTLPDTALIHGRMLVAAWDMGLEQGCEDKSIKLILSATNHFLKQLIVAIVTFRKGYRLRENRLVHSVGLPTLNPWVHNSWAVMDTMSNSYATEISQLGDLPHVPALPQTAARAERDSAFYLACSSDHEGPPQKAISVSDLFQTLQVKKNIIRCHTVYAVNMERICARLHHPD